MPVDEPVAPAVDAAPTPPVETPPAQSATPTPPVASEPDPFDSPDVDKFDRAYVEKVRKDAAKYRERAKQYEDVFSNYEDEERQVWLDLARVYQQDPDAAVAWMEQVVAEYKGGAQAPDMPTVDGGAPVPPTAPTAPTGDKPLTQADVERILAEREQTAAQQREEARQVEMVNSKIREFGYDPESAEGFRILTLAATQTGFDLDKAKAAFDAERQAWIDAYLAEKANDAGTTVTEPGVPGNQPTAIKGLLDSENAMRARFGLPERGAQVSR